VTDKSTSAKYTNSIHCLYLVCLRNIINPVTEFNLFGCRFNNQIETDGNTQYATILPVLSVLQPPLDHWEAQFLAQAQVSGFGVQPESVAVSTAFSDPLCFA
jgi:hypothetical protein